MSVAAISWVLEHSEAKLGARLVLIALANHAHDDGHGAYPTQATLAEETRMTDRQVRRCLDRLVEEGAIEATGKREKGIVCWRILMGTNCPPGQNVLGHSRQPPRTFRTAQVSKMSDKPSVNRQEPSGVVREHTTTSYDELVIES